MATPTRSLRRGTGSRHRRRLIGVLLLAAMLSGCAVIELTEGSITGDGTRPDDGAAPHPLTSGGRSYADLVEDNRELFEYFEKESLNLVPTLSTGEIEAIVAQLNDYWVDAAPRHFGSAVAPFPLDRAGFGEDGPQCNGQPIDVDRLGRDGSYVRGGCIEGILMAFDHAYIGLTQASAEATVAHSWGLVLQMQIPELDLRRAVGGRPIDGELQAVCLAGAWAAEEATASERSVGAWLAVNGEPFDRVPLDHPDAEGSIAERLTAFYIGLDEGPSGCVEELLLELPHNDDY